MIIESLYHKIILFFSTENWSGLKLNYLKSLLEQKKKKEKKGIDLLCREKSAQSLRLHHMNWKVWNQNSEVGTRHLQSLDISASG